MSNLPKNDDVVISKTKYSLLSDSSFTPKHGHTGGPREKVEKGGESYSPDTFPPVLTHVYYDTDSEGS